MVLFGTDVIRFGRSQNLVSRVDPAGEVARLIEESVRGGALLRFDGCRRWLDVGSGAGFPGVVLGILYPEWSHVLVERRSARCDFLERAGLRLQLRNVTVFSEDIRNVDLGVFDGVSSKAVADPREFLRWVGPHLGDEALALFFQRVGWVAPSGWSIRSSCVSLRERDKDDRMAFLLERR